MSTIAIKYPDYSNPITAESVDGNNAQAIAAFICQGIADNDVISNDGKVVRWSGADDAVDAYTDNYTDTGVRIEWDDDAIDDAREMVRKAMQASGHIK